MSTRRLLDCLAGSLQTILTLRLSTFSQGDVTPELFHTFQVFLSHPEALKRCGSMRFYRPIMNELHKEDTFAMAASTMITVLAGDGSEDLSQEWLTILVRVLCANIQVSVISPIS